MMMCRQTLRSILVRLTLANVEYTKIVVCRPWRPEFPRVPLILTFNVASTRRMCTSQPQHTVLLYRAARSRKCTVILSYVIYLCSRAAQACCHLRRLRHMMPYSRIGAPLLDSGPVSIELSMATEFQSYFFGTLDG
jgi:hypothetical protein